MTGDVNRKLIAAADFETDPFNGEAVYPFVLGLCLGPAKSDYHEFWGDDCIFQFLDFLKKLEDEYIIYFHNGGRFDFFLRQSPGGPSLLHYFSGKIKIINRRVVKGFIGGQEFRDSFAIFPEPLGSFKGKHKKLKDFDYDKMRRECRDQYRGEISEYLYADCITLYDHCVGFVEEFGDNLTIGGTAMKELRKLHEFDTFTGYDAAEQDAKYRQFYYGGRTQCFKEGYIEGPYRIYDVNGMYQKVMRDYEHPIGVNFSKGSKIHKRTDFALIQAKNYGALPMRTKTGVDFNVGEGKFFATIHEIEAGLDTNTLVIDKVIETYSCLKHGNFEKFIDTFYGKRDAMKAINDLMRDSFYKRVMNAAYGKFAQNPEDYKDYEITLGKRLDPPWREVSRHDGWIIWEKPATRRQYLNVATAASITGAARAILLRGLCASNDPVYCDTDSIICLSMADNADIHPTRLGAWKHEGKKGPDGNMVYDAESIAIAGKKLYSVFGDAAGTEFSMKHACKGVKLTPEQIRAIASGKEQFVQYASPAPTFGLDGSIRFIHRNVRKTAVAGRLGA